MHDVQTTSITSNIFSANREHIDISCGCSECDHRRVYIIRVLHKHSKRGKRTSNVESYGFCPMYCTQYNRISQSINYTNNQPPGQAREIRPHKSVTGAFFLLVTSCLHRQFHFHYELNLSLEFVSVSIPFLFQSYLSEPVFLQ
ncbi:hypothetical protein BsWGS_27357 [Bradybaena similaris]